MSEFSSAGRLARASSLSIVLLMLVATGCGAPYKRWSFGCTDPELAGQVDDLRRFRLRAAPEGGGQEVTSRRNQLVRESLYGCEIGEIECDRSPWMGLALSGGGIRSTAFSTGVLQGLHELGLLDRFGYLSSVSGGGFAAGWYMSHFTEPGVLDLGSPEIAELVGNGYYLTSTHFSRARGELVHKTLLHLAFWPLAALFTEGLHLHNNVYGYRDFYRRAIERAFLGGEEKPVLPSVTDRCGTSWESLRKFLPSRMKQCDGRRPPFWIVNSHLVLRDEVKAAYRNRTGDAFETTPLRAGSDAVGYVVVPDRTESEEFWMRPSYALAISGAALDSDGSVLGPVQTLFTYGLNLDLGYWIRGWSPRWSYGNHLLNGLGYLLFAPAPMNRILSLVVPDTAWGLRDHRFLTDSLYFGLTDGGHFDNLGVYALVRRGCRVIVVADASEDPYATNWEGFKGSAQDRGQAFENLIRVQSLLESDFGAELEIEWNEFSVRGIPTALIGKIENLPIAGSPKRDVVVIVLKAAFQSGDENQGASALLDREKALNPGFPDDSLYRQFFKEDQFNAYRRLGLEVVRTNACTLRCYMQTCKGPEEKKERF